MFKIFPMAILCFMVLIQTQSLSAQQTDGDYKIQGEYTGSLNANGEELKYGIQVIALGEGKFTGVGYMGGLPGDGWDRSEPMRIEDVPLADGKLVLQGDAGVATIRNGAAIISHSDGQELGKLERVVRKSKTLGAKPPAASIVLFDSSDVKQWEGQGGKPAKMTDDGLLIQGVTSKPRFDSHRLHIEFMLPYQPKARGQGRGNSGIYLQGRYEVQMLDSFGLTGEANECGGIYSIKKPDQNMCFPPLQWQTYDIEFHAAQFEGDQKTKNAWMTVKHNGVTIHEKVELPNKTTAAPINEGPEPGYVYLQDHGNPVRYKNIWVEEIEEN